MVLNVDFFASVMRNLAEVFIWVWLFHTNINVGVEYIHISSLLSAVKDESMGVSAMAMDRHDTLTAFFQYSQVSIIRNSLCATTIFFWRSFEVHSAYARVMVENHKLLSQAPLRKGKAQAGGFNRAWKVLKGLQTLHPWREHFGALDAGCCQTQPATNVFAVVVTTASMSGIVLGLLNLALSQELPARNRLFGDSDNMLLGWWCSMLGSSALVAYGWAHLMWAAMAVMEGLEHNICQVLIFSCLARLTTWSDFVSGVESLNARNRARAKVLLDGCFVAEADGTRDQNRLEIYCTDTCHVNRRGCKVNMGFLKEMFPDCEEAKIQAALSSLDERRKEKFLEEVKETWDWLHDKETQKKPHFVRQKRIQLESSLQAFLYEIRQQIPGVLASHPQIPGVLAEDYDHPTEAVYSDPEEMYLWLPNRHLCPGRKRARSLTCGDAELLYRKLYEDTDRLSFAYQHDLQAWWLLRKYIHSDLTDEAVQMELVGVTVAGLLFVFFLFAAMDYLLNYSVVSIAQIAVYLSSAPLFFLMWHVFRYGIDINALLLRDAEVLSDAAMYAALFPTEMWGAGGAARGKLTQQLDLMAMQRNAEVTDSVQTLLGVRITSAYLTGWIVSLVFTVLAWVQGLAAPYASIDGMVSIFDRLQSVRKD